MDIDRYGLDHIVNCQVKVLENHCHDKQGWQLKHNIAKNIP